MACGVCVNLPCGVCHDRMAKSIITSSLISACYPTCNECYNNQAEPTWIFDYVVKHGHNKENVIFFFSTIVDGKLVAWQDYEKNNKEKKPDSKQT